MNEPPFIKTRDALINQLKLKIGYLQPELCDQILAYLISNTSDDNLLDMLVNDSLLEDKVQKYVLFLDQEKLETLGSELFEAVCLIEQELSAQITGMLLELPLSTINSLLCNRKYLKDAIQRAKERYILYLKEKNMPSFNHKCEKNLHIVSQNQVVDYQEMYFSKDEIGEVIYHKLSEQYPQYAAKLTGMLLQMDYLELRNILTDDNKLQRNVKIALQAISK